MNMEFSTFVISSVQMNIIHVSVVLIIVPINDTYISLLVSCWTDMYPAWYTMTLHSGGGVDSIPKQTASWHLNTNNPSNYWTTVKTYSDL